MAKGMAHDVVAGGGGLGDEAGKSRAPQVATDHKEGGADVEAGAAVEEARHALLQDGVIVVAAVVADAMNGAVTPGGVEVDGDGAGAQGGHGRWGPSWRGR